MESDRPVCARCGEAIGTYERIYADYGQAAPISTGWLSLPREPPPRALWHADCGEPRSGCTAARDEADAAPARRRRGSAQAPAQRPLRRVSL